MKNKESAISWLGALHYQICNGGLSQACYNGYVDNLIDDYGSFTNWLDQLEKEVDLRTSEGKEAIKAANMITDAVNNLSMEQYCTSCDGNGYTTYEEEDEDGNINTVEETCYDCNGNGTIEVDSYKDIDVDCSFDGNRWDDKYYTEINSDLIDDLTNQSHNHSVFMDAIEKNESYKGEKHMLLSEAKQILRNSGFKVILEKTENDVELIANVYIKHDTVKTANMTTKEGRRTYHMLHRAFGVGVDKNDEKNQKIGGSTVGMTHKSGEKVSSSWTWIDIDAIKDQLSKFGIDVTEQHGQAKITKDVNDEAIADWGHDGAYGENSNSIWYFITTSERNWQIKFAGTIESVVKFLTACGLEDVGNSKEDIELAINHGDGQYYIEKLVKDAMPAYKNNNEDYDIDVTVKVD